MNTGIKTSSYRIDDDYNLGDLKSSMRGALPPTGEELSSLVDTVTFIHIQYSTICVLTLKGRSGYNVIGTSSAMNPDNYSEELGAEYAQADAVKKLMDLEVYIIHKDRSRI